MDIKVTSRVDFGSREQDQRLLYFMFLSYIRHCSAGPPPANSRDVCVSARMCLCGCKSLYILSIPLYWRAGGADVAQRDSLRDRSLVPGPQTRPTRGWGPRNPWRETAHRVRSGRGTCRSQSTCATPPRSCTTRTYIHGIQRQPHRSGLTQHHLHASQMYCTRTQFTHTCVSKSWCS